jgi:hydroxymethylglutaryl-CoA reductase
LGTFNERFQFYREKFNLSEEEISYLHQHGGLNTYSADKMSENVIGTASRPLYILPNLKVNGKEYSIPIATEQPTIIQMIKKGLDGGS